MKAANLPVFRTWRGRKLQCCLAKNDV